jgi:hypothetical protein
MQLMRVDFASWAFAVLALGLPACTQETEMGAEQSTSPAPPSGAESQAESPAPIADADGVYAANVCTIREHAEQLDGETIRLNARYVDLNSYAMLADPDCPNFAMRLIRRELNPSDAIFDGTTAFLENVIMNGSTTFFTDTIDVYATYTGTYHRQFNADYHVLVLDSVAEISFEEHAPDEAPPAE